MVGIKSGLASALAAACVKTTLQPIDAVKTLQQHRQQLGNSLTIVQACRELLQRPNGAWNFYSGLGITVFGSMPGVALYFGVYSYLKKRSLRTEWGKRNPVLCIATSAAIGNSIASFSRVPYEVLKQQLQTQVYSSTWEAFQTIAREGRWLSMLFPKGGIAIQMIRDVPYAVVTLLMYEYLQSRVVAKDPNKQRMYDFIVGGIAGGIGSWVTNPMDVVKTRLQTNSDLYGGSVQNCIAQVWDEGGGAAFLRGSIPRLAHKIPANAFFFLFYEFFKRILRVEEGAHSKGTKKTNVKRDPLPRNEGRPKWSIQFDLKGIKPAKN